MWFSLPDIAYFIYAKHKSQSKPDKTQNIIIFTMKGRQTDSSNFCTIRYGAPIIRLTRWNSINSSIFVIYVLTATVFLPQLIFCQTDSNVTATSVGLKNVTVNAQSSKVSISKSPGTSFSLSSSSEEDYYFYSDNDDGNHNSTRKWYGHGQRSKTSKTVQAVVYCSVILISLVGILIKYFVTHYETSQIKAQEQLQYQRLHNQVA